MKCCNILAALLCLTAAMPAAAQHTLTFRGDTVTWIRIEEDNSYREWNSHERVFPPEAWVDYYPIFNEQMLLKRNARRTKTTKIDSTALLHLDSLMLEIGECRMATAADLGITEKMLHKTLHSWDTRNRFGLKLIYLISHSVSMESFERWLAKEYEENKDTNVFSYMTDTYGFINVGISTGISSTTYVSIWRYHPQMPYQLNVLNRFNLNIYRHLCALMPKTSGYSYKDFQRLLIQAYFSYLTN